MILLFTKSICNFNLLQWSSIWILPSGRFICCGTNEIFSSTLRNISYADSCATYWLLCTSTSNDESIYVYVYCNRSSIASNVRRNSQAIVNLHVGLRNLIVHIEILLTSPTEEVKEKDACWSISVTNLISSIETELSALLINDHWRFTWWRHFHCGCWIDNWKENFLLINIEETTDLMSHFDWCLCSRREKTNVIDSLLLE